LGTGYGYAIYRYHLIEHWNPGILHNKLVIHKRSYQRVTVYFAAGLAAYKPRYTATSGFFTDKNKIKDYAKNGFVLEWSCSNDPYSKNWSQFNPDMMEKLFQKDSSIRLLKGFLITAVVTFLVILLTPFFRMDPLLYHKFENMVIFRSRKLYSLCSPENQGYQKIIYFFCFSSKKEIDNAKVVFLLELVGIINLFDYRTLMADFDLF